MIGKQAIALVTAAVGIFWLGPAGAAVTQLDGTVIPQPVPSAAISVVTSRGFPSSAGTLAGLFQNFAGGVDRNLDPIADASTTPGTFDPTCGLKVSIVLQGGGCAMALGWYNATQPPGPPSASDIYPAIPADLKGAFPSGISCQDGDFCPLAQRETDPGQAGQHTWADPLPAFDPQITSSPNWRGGPVGFVLMGGAGQCSQSKYSELDLNVTSTKYGAPWVTVLVYPSMAAPGAVYLAFDDLPYDPAGWNQYGADGAFVRVYQVAPTPCGNGAAGASGVGSGGRGAAGAPGGASGAAGGASGAAGGAGGASAAAGGTAGGTTGPAGGASGAAGGSAGHASSTGGRISTGGSPGAAGAASGAPAAPGGDGGCQTAGGPGGGPVCALVVVALAGLRRRSKSVQKSARIRCA